MSEDLEDLLTQVEKKYFSQEAKSLAATPARDCECNKLKTTTNWDEVEDLLKDFAFEDTNPFAKSNNKSWIRQELPTQSTESSNNRKCYPVYLSGSYKIMGFSETGNERPCDQLKCLSCDFKVIYFDNYAWDTSTDYLFLRNNMPDFENLASKLCKRRGIRAYGCQCQCVSITSLTNLSTLSQLKWICGKHPM